MHCARRVPGITFIRYAQSRKVGKPIFQKKKIILICCFIFVALFLLLPFVINLFENNVTMLKQHTNNDFH
jgi:hypothetical protein